MFDYLKSALLVALALCAASCQTVAAAAGPEPKLTIAPSLVAVGVTPPVAPPGTLRKIVVSGVWPNGCAPTSATLGLPLASGRPAIGVLLFEPQTLVVCTSALTPYRFEFEYRPPSAGQLDILVMTNLGTALGKGTLVTGSAQDPRAAWDISGAWYDPQTSGSGLMIAHDFGGSDAVFATWQVYDPATGLARWYTLQEGRWNPNGSVLEATLYETFAAPSTACLTCPRPAQQIVDRGHVRLTFSVNGANGGLDAVLELAPATGPAERLASLRRFLPERIVLY
jgi:hypothetical protein